MSLSIAQELKQTFHLHALRHEASHKLTGRQWEKHAALKNRCQQASELEIRLFNERYETRIEQEYQKLLHEKNGKTKEFKPEWAQDDSFSKAALLSQADTNVRARHEQRLGRIDQFETRELETLLRHSVRENQLTDKSKQAFNKSADRRKNAERRKRPLGSHRRIFRRQTQ